MSSLKNQVIKLAYQHPTLREDILPLVATRTAMDVAEAARALLISLAPHIAPLKAMGSGVVTVLRDLMRKPGLSKKDEQKINRSRKILENEAAKIKKRLPPAVTRKLLTMPLGKKINVLKGFKIPKMGSALPLPATEERDWLWYLGISAILELLGTLYGRTAFDQDVALYKGLVVLAYEKPAMQVDLLPVIQRHKNASIMADFIKMMPHWIRGVSVLVKALWLIHDGKTLAAREAAAERAIEIAEHYADGVEKFIIPNDIRRIARMDAKQLVHELQSMEMMHLAQKGDPKAKKKYLWFKLISRYAQRALDSLRSGRPLIRLGFVDLGSLSVLWNNVLQGFQMLQGVGYKDKQIILTLGFETLRIAGNIGVGLLTLLYYTMRNKWDKDTWKAAKYKFLSKIESAKDKVRKHLTRRDVQEIGRMPTKEKIETVKKKELDPERWDALQWETMRFAKGAESNALRKYIVLDVIEDFVRRLEMKDAPQG